MLPTDGGAGNRVRNKTYQMRALFNITGACSVLLAITGHIAPRLSNIAAPVRFTVAQELYSHYAQCFRTAITLISAQSAHSIKDHTSDMVITCQFR